MLRVDVSLGEFGAGQGFAADAANVNPFAQNEFLKGESGKYLIIYVFPTAKVIQVCDKNKVDASSISLYIGYRG